MSCCAVAGLWLILASTGSASAAPLRAGVARAEITPLQPVTMSGYESRKGLSQGVHDPLYARAVAFECDGHRLVLVSSDVIGYYRTADLMRQSIMEACRLQPNELFLAGIHTHSAPTITFDTEKGHSNNVAYSNWLKLKLAEVVDTALWRLEPVELGIGSGASPVGANRRQVTQDDSGKTKIVLGRNPTTPVDHEVQVLKLSRKASSNAVAALFAYPSHSTSLGPANYIISGDVHGLAEQFVEKYLGFGLVAAGFAGTSGDIDPWYRVLPGFKTDNGWVPETVVMGTMLGEEVVHVLDRIQKTSSTGPVNAMVTKIQLPSKPDPNTFVTAPVPLTVSVARIGNVAFVGLGGEVFNEIGQAIKAQSPFPCTFVMTHCNGAAGYLPTAPSYQAGGYEVQSSPFGPGAAEMIPDQVTELLNELRRD
jgi:neutral ceramidase